MNIIILDEDKNRCTETTPVMPMASANTLAWVMPFWPVVASSTSNDREFPPFLRTIPVFKEFRRVTFSITIKLGVRPCRIRYFRTTANVVPNRVSGRVV